MIWGVLLFEKTPKCQENIHPFSRVAQPPSPHDATGIVTAGKWHGNPDTKSDRWSVAGCHRLPGGEAILHSGRSSLFTIIDHQLVDNYHG